MNIIGKLADKRLADLGFQKVNDDEFSVIYRKYIQGKGYIHELAILHKKSGDHIIQSYDPELMDSKKIGCTNVGLTKEIAFALLVKLNSKGW